MLKRIKLGQSDLDISRIGLGTMGMSEFYGQTDETESIATIHEAIEKGVNFLDTADMYGSGRNEELLKKALEGKRDQVVLATKFGILRDGAAFAGLSAKPSYVKEACEASLKRLGTDVIDLYYLHRLDPQTPIEDTVGAMSALVKEGKVRYLGLSEVSGETLKKAHAVHPIAALQSEYSLWSTDIEGVSIPTAKELGTTLVAYSPLGRGFLTGQIKSFEDLAEDDYRRTNPRFQGENFQKNLALVKAVEAMAASKNIKPAQLALAWVLAQGENIAPIPGTKRRKYLLENIAADRIQLSKAELDQLGQMMVSVAGTRYNEGGMHLVNA